jgi:inositol phosphorylceramide mannosyltransferase catalytic subunit
MIVKKIFQTWKTREVPRQWADAQASVIKMNPGWEYVLLTDEDNERIVKEHFPDFYPHFMAFPHPIQRADAVRYCVMYLYGGIYLDLDYEALKPFDDLVLEKGVGLIESNNNVFQTKVTNSFLASAVPGHPFWLACIEETKKGVPWYAVTKHLEVFMTTGPFMLDRVYRANKDAVQILKNVSVVCNVCQVGHCKGDTSYYIKPISGNSWHSWDSTAMNALYCKLDVFLFLAFLGITTLR